MVRFAAVAAPLLPGIAGACPNCYGSSEGSVLQMYYWSTALLSVLPFAIAASVYLLASRARQRATTDESGQHASALSTTGKPSPTA